MGLSILGDSKYGFEYGSSQKLLKDSLNLNKSKQDDLFSDAIMLHSAELEISTEPGSEIKTMFKGELRP